MQHPYTKDRPFPVGTIYKPIGENSTEHTVIDVMVMRSRVLDKVIYYSYVTAHTFMGQTLITYDVTYTTIARGLVSLPVEPKRYTVYNTKTMTVVAMFNAFSDQLIQCRNGNPDYVSINNTHPSHKNTLQMLIFPDHFQDQKMALDAKRKLQDIYENINYKNQ